ncbi:MAG: DUF3795 domain-containing protein [Brevinematia bacterium]
MIAFCGLDCSKCPAYIATIKNDDNERKKVAKEWSQMFHADITPDSVNCYGCKTEGKPRFYYCANMCEIRKCAVSKGVENCGKCKNYSCIMLEEFLKNAPVAKENLEKMNR